jgi:hypothetical protein
MARFLGRGVHLGWLGLLAAVVWMAIQFQGATGDMAELGLVIVAVFMLLPLGLGWAIGAALGLHWRARAQAADKG